jgi:PAS domain S-box-containing protein
MFNLGRGKDRARLNRLILILQQRLHLATYSLEKISGGSFNIEIPNENGDLLDESGKAFYRTLHSVKEKLGEYAQKENERKWTAEGMNQFMALTSGNEQTKADFYDHVLKFIVQYTEANQGGIFLLNDSEDDPYLELTACYAFGKKKFLEKKIGLGQGMLGQCYLEKQTSYFTLVPNNYTKITSGLGEATPTCLIMIPLRYDRKVLGIIELAYFKTLAPFKIEFLEKLAESIASSTLTHNHAKRAEILFEESQTKAKILQEQEETLRQNVEELLATQEEMKRQQAELHGQSNLMKFIIDNIPFPIFVKDEKGKYALVNKAESKLFNLQDKDLIGKDDSHFVSRNEEWQLIKRSDESVLSSNEPLELPLQHFTTVTGKSYIFKTTKIPFFNEVTQKKNILGVSIDLTEKLTLEKKLLNEKLINQNNVFLNISGRQRMLSQKIGFYCEALVRGRAHHAGLLRDAIELHEHSLQVMRYGGIPMGISCDSPLLPIREELIGEIEKVETIWQPYKKAAENILYFYLTENTKGGHHSSLTEEFISIIEDNGELLLNANNDFMTAYLELSKVKQEVL